MILKRTALLCLMTFVFLFLAGVSNAGENLREVKVPDRLSPGLDHLLNMVGSQSNGSFRPQLMEEILQFVATADPAENLYYADKKFGATSAYYGFDIHETLEHILKFAYNPDIPSAAFLPSSTRLSYWTEVQGQNQPFPKLWHFLPDLKTPVVITGVKHIENTPDLYTGAYYAYDLNRIFCLFKYKGRRTLITLSKQRDTSNVGKKGLVLGADENWDYLYSTREGLAKPGLGWVRSYMYDSYSIAVFYEKDEKEPLVKCGFFKWIDAGWSEINMVRKKHIYRGLERFGKTFKEIIEYPFLPKASELEKVFKDIQQLGIDALREKTKAYLTILKSRYIHDKALARDEFTKLFESEKYLHQMKKEEMQSILDLECIKCILGKDKQTASIVKPICEQSAIMSSKNFR